MNSTIQELIEKLHQSPVKCVLALTGGGTGAAAGLLGVPGGSRTILEVVIPYGEQALIDFLGRRPEHFCSLETAQAMAGRACERAMWLAPGQPVLGLGCTASLASDRPKRGDHRFHMACRRAGQTSTNSLVLTKSARDRATEEQLLDLAILNSLAEALSLDTRLELPLLSGETIETVQSEPGGLTLVNAANPLGLTLDGRLTPENRPLALLPGAFNPVHDGHWALAELAGRKLGVPVAFELSMDNVDKPPLLLEEVRRRLYPFAWKAQVWITRAPTFVQKANLFPGTVFVVGADTAERIVAPRYYGGEQGMLDGLAVIRDQGCRFLVAGRRHGQGHFLGLDDLSIPVAFRTLFSAIPREEFEMDISSTALRKCMKSEEESG